MVADSVITANALQPRPFLVGLGSRTSHMENIRPGVRSFSYITYQPDFIRTHEKDNTKFLIYIKKNPTPKPHK